MEVKLFNQSGEEIKKVNLPDEIFGVKVDDNLIWQSLQIQSANSRQVLAHAKGRGEVRGGGKKPWRQKGTGRARHASIRSPIWKGGGATFGPTKEVNFARKINKKARRKALFMGLSSKVRDGQMLLLDSLKLEKAKTKNAASILTSLAGQFEGYRVFRKKRDPFLIVIPKNEAEIKMAFNNLKYAEIISAKDLNIKKVLDNKYMILLEKSVDVIRDNFKIKR